MTKTNSIRTVCLDFDGTIMVYEDPVEHFHPQIVDALNRLGDMGVEWIANSGRSFESQLTVVDNAREHWGLRYAPAAILSYECYIHLPNGAEGFSSWDEWNEPARKLLLTLHRRVQQDHGEELRALIERLVPDGVYLRDDRTVFRIQDLERRRAMESALTEFLSARVKDMDLILNGEWLALVPARYGKGNVLLGYLDHRGWTPDHALAIGDHGNDISMLTGQAAHHVGCPSDAHEPVLHTVRAAGGYVGEGIGPLGTLEVLRHYLPGSVVSSEVSGASA